MENKEVVRVFDELLGKSFNVTECCDELSFRNDKEHYCFYHEQDCCENVFIESIEGDLDDISNSPLLMAEEVTMEEPPLDYDYESYTWTFYKFATIKGTVVIRWLGTSNGYYSERVHFRTIRSS